MFSVQHVLIYREDQGVFNVLVSMSITQFFFFIVVVFLFSWCSQNYFFIINNNNVMIIAIKGCGKAHKDSGKQSLINSKDKSKDRQSKLTQTRPDNL